MMFEYSQENIIQRCCFTWVRVRVRVRAFGLWRHLNTLKRAYDADLHRDVLLLICMAFNPHHFSCVGEESCNT